MRRMMLTNLSLLAIALVFGACGANLDDQATAEQDAVSTYRLSFVTLRHDQRKCMSPLCGGYFVQDVNGGTAERYVSGLDFSRADLDDDSIARVQAAPAEELVLRGKLGPAEWNYNTRTFLVYEAYRGMPGMRPVSGEAFYKVQDRDPQIRCFMAPCPNLVALTLNTSTQTIFDSTDVMRASAPHVDQNWLAERLHGRNAIAAGVIRDGTLFPGGYEKVLDASQVYVRLPERIGPCPMMPIPNCDPLTATFTRSADRCLVFDACADHSNCPSLQPAICAEGYELQGWPTNTVACIAFACDPIL